MVVLNEGINKIRDLLNAQIDEGDWGTGTTAALVSDTGLQTEVASIEQATTNTTADKTINIKVALPSTAGNSNTISEHVIRTTDGTDISRNVFSGITKTSSKEIHNLTTIVFQKGN